MKLEKKLKDIMRPYDRHSYEALDDLHKASRKIEKEFHKKYFASGVDKNNQVIIKLIDGESFNLTSRQISERIEKIYTNLMGFDKPKMPIHNTNFYDAFLIADLSDQLLINRGYVNSEQNQELVRTVSKSACSIYFIQCQSTKLIKIGFASNIKNRFSSIQTGSPTPLKIIGAVVCDKSIEKKLHDKFENIRVHGEWFKPSDYLLRIAEKTKGESGLHYILDIIGDYDYEPV